jgi:hypothetical protein
LTIGSSVLSAAGLPPPGCDRDADLASYEPNRASRAVSKAVGLRLHEQRDDFGMSIPDTFLEDLDAPFYFRRPQLVGKLQAEDPDSLIRGEMSRQDLVDALDA